MCQEATVGSYIRWIRKKRGYTVRSLAKKVGIDHAHLSRIETNKIVPSEKTLKKLAIALDAPHLFVIANRALPLDLMQISGANDQVVEWKEKEKTKSYPSTDPFCGIIPDHPDIFPEGQNWLDIFTSLDIPHAWIKMPPPIRSEIVRLRLQRYARTNKLPQLEQEKLNRLDEGIEKGLIKSFQIFRDHLKENPLWFFAFFFPPIKARLLALFYELLENASSSLQPKT